MQMSEEAIREAVLLETLSRLLREKIGAGGAGASSAGATVPPWRRSHNEAATTSVDSAVESSKVSQAGQAEAAPPATSVAVIGAPEIKQEAPLEKFIRVFRLDELAAKCLLKLQDDEAAFVIELLDKNFDKLCTSFQAKLLLKPSERLNEEMTGGHSLVGIEVHISLWQFSRP